MEGLAPAAKIITSSASGWLFVLAFLTSLELLWPMSGQSWRDRITGLSFWAVWIPFSALIETLFRLLWRALEIQPLLKLSVDLSWAGASAWILSVLVGSMLYDFVFYWCHRFQHARLWRFHAVHHSIRDLSAINSYHHISEQLVQTLLITIPTSLIVANTGVIAPAIVGLVLWVHIVFLHSPTRLHLGPLRLVFADNCFHRIHHSLEERHFDKNFGAFTTVWDRLFGTAYFPRRNEWPDTGLAEIQQPGNVPEWLDLPSRLKLAAAPELDAGNVSRWPISGA